MHSWAQSSINELDHQVQALGDSHPCPIVRAMDEILPHNSPLSQIHSTRMALRLGYLRRDVKSILGDGSCLFRAFAYVMTGTEDNHLDLRHIAVNHICASPHLQVFDPDFNRRTYRASMSVPVVGVWPGQLEIVALVEILRCNVYIISSTQDNWYVVHLNPLFTRSVLL